VVSEPPQISFRPRQTGAVNTRLLSGSNPDNRPAVCVGDTVGLSVLEGECSDNQVPYSISWKLRARSEWDGRFQCIKETHILVLCNYVVKQPWADLCIVPFLREVNPIHLSCFEFFRNVVGINLRGSFSTS
jgi:hypothetical protein